MSSSTPHDPSTATVDNNEHAAEIAVPVDDTVILERFEFGKPCVEPDGNVLFLGNSPAEYQILYQSDFFAQEPVDWSQPQFRMGFSNAQTFYIAHTPYLRKTSTESTWIALTQVHENRKELDTDTRSYTISRFAAQVASSVVPLEDGDLLSPHSICQAVLEEPITGFMENPDLKPFELNRKDIINFPAWKHADQTLAYTLQGIPVCIMLRETEPGVFSPSLKEFAEWASTLWYFLPLSLRPWFSWGWNVNIPQSSQPLLFFASSAPPDGVIVLDGDQWISRVSRDIVEKAHSPRETSWNRILRTYHGNQDALQVKYGEYLDHTNISYEMVPYARPAHREVERSLLPPNKNSIHPTHICRHHLSPFLMSIRSALHGLELAYTIDQWLLSDNPKPLQLDIGTHDIELVWKVIERALSPQWHAFYTETAEPKPTLSRLIDLTWTWIHAVYQRFSGIKPRFILQRFPESSDIQSMLSLMILSAKPLASTGIVEIMGLIQLILSNQEKPLIKELFNRFQTNGLPLSFQQSFYQRLDKFSWPYNELEADVWKKHYKLFLHICKLFPNWGAQTIIRQSVLQFNIQYSSNTSFQWNELPATETLIQIQQDAPSIHDLKSQMVREEFMALLFYMVHVELKLGMTRKRKTSALAFETARLTWCWDLTLQATDAELHEIFIPIAESPHRVWLSLLRHGIDHTMNSPVIDSIRDSLIGSNTRSMWIQFQILDRLSEPLHCPTPQNKRAWMHISEFVYRFFNSDMFEGCPKQWKQLILSFFPTGWPLLLTSDTEMGCSLEEHRSWSSPFETLDGSVELDRALMRVVENLSTRSYEQYVIDNTVTLIVAQIRNIPSIVFVSNDLQQLYDFFVDTHNSQKSTASVQLVDARFFQLLKLLVKASSALEGLLGNIWKNLVNRRPSSKTSKETSMLFSILCAHTPLRHVLQPTHIAHLVNNTDDKQKILISRGIETIRSVLTGSVYNTELAANQTHIEATLDILEQLLIKPKMFAIQNHWSPIFANSLSALCFERAPITAFPPNHHSKWSEFFGFTPRELFIQEAKFAQKYKQLPVHQPQYIHKYNGILQSDSGIQPLEFTVPRRILSSDDKHAPFRFLMSNWSSLKSTPGHLPGRFKSLQAFLQFKRFTATVLLTLVNLLAVGIGYWLHSPLMSIIKNQSLPHETPLVLFGIAIIALIWLSLLVHSQIVKYCEGFRPRSIVVTSDRNTERTDALIKKNDEKQNAKIDDGYFKSVDVIEIPDDIFDALNILATNISWTGLFGIKR